MPHDRNAFLEYVVPHAGTWIEISMLFALLFSSAVVPHAGTWIEIILVWLMKFPVIVVPHAGTWIEIADTRDLGLGAVSFPTRERGLKYNNLAYIL